MAVVRFLVAKRYRGSLPDTITVHSVNLTYSSPGSSEIKFRQVVGAPSYQAGDKALLILTKFKYFDDFAARGYRTGEYTTARALFLRKDAQFLETDELFTIDSGEPDMKAYLDNARIHNAFALAPLAGDRHKLGETVESILKFYDNLKEQDQE